MKEGCAVRSKLNKFEHVPGGGGGSSLGSCTGKGDCGLVQEPFHPSHCEQNNKTGTTENVTFP